MGGRRSDRPKPVSVAEWDASFVEGLDANWQQYLQLDLATATHMTYNSQQQQYRQFCALLRREQLPDAHILAQFGLRAAGEPDPEVRRTLKVAAKLAVPKGLQKLPLNRRDLRRAVYHLADRGSNDFVGVRDRALLLLDWVGIFRSSELVGVQLRDVSFAESRGALIYVPGSKTDQAGQGAWVFIAACREESFSCPVAALRALKALAFQGGRQVAAKDFVFTGQRDGRVGLAKTTLAIPSAQGAAGGGHS
eukprot:gene3252-biopygen4910